MAAIPECCSSAKFSRWFHLTVKKRIVYKGIITCMSRTLQWCGCDIKAIKLFNWNINLYGLYICTIMKWVNYAFFQMYPNWEEMHTCVRIHVDIQFVNLGPCQAEIMGLCFTTIFWCLALPAWARQWNPNTDQIRTDD